jgi:elongation factor P--(R)-beta-lysine ligase
MSGVGSDWRPTASIPLLQARAALLRDTRAFFAQAGVLEVETPVCSIHATTDPAIESLRTDYTGPDYPQGVALYLHSSPEFAMKRLLAAGSGPIYQICRVFRDGECGRLHHPEFTLLEWYRPGFDHQQLMDDVAKLICTVARRSVLQQRIAYSELFREYLHLNIHDCDIAALRAAAQGIIGIDHLALSGRDAWLDLLLTHGIEPHLPPDQMTFIYDYPASQAALARIRPGDPPLAERFELYLGGMELANGFHELGDAVEQEQRFQADLVARQARGQRTVSMDRRLLAALQSGLPDCAGVALGMDRLLMWLSGTCHINQVVTFHISRA